MFGTDGVRGRANTGHMTAGTALRLGAAAGRHFARDATENGAVHRVVIGKDTRLSGYMFETALTAGLASTGMHVFQLGPVPTPAVGFLTRSMRADLGVMISASHNPAEDNGIKFFGPDGFKLSDADEAAITALVETGVEPVDAPEIGRVKRIDTGAGRYVEAVKASVPPGMGFEGIKVVVDCANGAAYKVAPEALWELGADVIPLGVAPDGRNINRGCGSTHTTPLREAVVAHGADVGIALDGDADRIILVDEHGVVGDGDQIMALFAERLHAEGRLPGGVLAATVMSNLGLERHLAGLGLRLHRTKVGDRHVVEALRANGWALGGEQSGHIVMTDFATTGDGLLAGLQFLAAMKATGQPASALLRRFETVPQVLENVRFAPGTDPLNDPSVQAAIAAAEADVAGRGRVLIRASGTEPLIRVMVEHEDEAAMRATAGTIASAVARAGRVAAE